MEKNNQQRIPRDIPLKKCNHVNVKIISPTKMRCKCGATWTGPNIKELYKLFTS